MADRGERQGVRERIALGWVFALAALRYWLIVFPRVCRELRALRRKAGEIPEPVLRALAFDALEQRGNIEGAAAFAAFVPRARRVVVMRALVAFQAAYNYLDYLGEQPNVRAVENGRRLHAALLAAVDPAAAHLDYYELCTWHEDGGYLLAMLEDCRAALAALPSYAAVAAPVHAAATRIADFQSLHLSREQGGHEGLERWARAQTPAGSALQWWETAASGGSSLAVFALIALAGETRVHASDAAAVERAYFPWVGALHSLLDNLVDRCEDDRNGQRSLVDYYASEHDAALRMRRLAQRALRAARGLRGGRRHSVVLASMASYYLSMPEAAEPDIAPVSEAVLAELRGPARLALAVFALRRRLARARERGDTGAAVAPDGPSVQIEHSVSVGWRNGWGRVV